KEAVKIDSILEKIARRVSYEHHEDEFTQDVTGLVEDEIRSLVDGDLELEDVGEIIEATSPRREITVLEDECLGCGACINECPVDCIELEMPSPIHISEKCVSCGRCVEVCPVQAIQLSEEFFQALEGKILFKRQKVEGPRSGEVFIDQVSCQACGVCVNKCPADAMTMDDDVVTVDPEKCINCGECESICPVRAVRLIINN
ncbi:MAG: 4Fe-4S binding protein, partial [Methanobacteriaceae archaeon]|nr:4Fe-4S binding protein [Methanobacteriaceae archaeon]